MSEYTDDPYKELGVEPTADTATIKKAYRKLALQDQDTCHCHSIQTRTHNQRMFGILNSGIHR